MAGRKGVQTEKGPGATTVRRVPHQGADQPNWQRRVVDRSLSKAAQRSLDKGAGLIAAAAKLMEKTGGDSFTVQDVANEAGQSLRSFYQHFGGKDDLFLAVFEDAMRVYAHLLSEDIDRCDDPLDRLTAGVLSVARLTRRSSQGMVVVLSRLRMKLTEIDPDLVASSTSPVTSMLRGLVAAARDTGLAGPCDPDVAAYSIFSLAAAVSTSRLLGNAYDLEVPSDLEFARFCLLAVGARLPEGWESAALPRDPRVPRAGEAERRPPTRSGPA